MISYHKNIDLKNYSFLITGGAGFIGSNIVEYLMQYNAGKVVVLDNLSTGKIENINHYGKNKNLIFIKGDTRDLKTCLSATKCIDFVSHQAALGSVPLSIKNPLNTHTNNVDGFVNMLFAAKENKIKRFIFASSSSVYGDINCVPNKEEITGNPLSPYAVTKVTNELYANVFSLIFSLDIIGLRYFNVFGKRQDPSNPYSAVIPLFINAIKKNKPVYINGDSTISRDFTHIDNVVQANILSFFVTKKESLNQVYNIGRGEQTSLMDLYKMIKKQLNSSSKIEIRAPRVGDIHDSMADISKAKKYLNYKPLVDVKKGLQLTISHFK